jgi:hypothetical protein
MGHSNVLIDSRLSSRLQERMWGVGDWAFVLPEGDTQRVELETNPPRNSELHIINDAGQVLRRISLEKPLAKVTEARVWDNKTSYLVEMDYSIGFGSYAGVTTLLMDVVDGQFKWAESSELGSHQTQQIRLPKTLKSSWKFVPFGSGHDILWVDCHPAGVQVPGHEFVVRYLRYRFDGNKWIKYERQREGFWESDQHFPPISAFP